MQARSGIGKQTLRGSAYSLAASMVTLVFGLIRSILLARLLLPEHFGTVALALFFIGLAGRLRELGIGMAFIHRQDGGPDLTRTFFSLGFALHAAALVVLLALTPLLARFYPHYNGLAAVWPVLVSTYFLSDMSQLQEARLRKGLAFGRISVTDVTASAVMTLVAPFLAWRGWGVWALVAEQVSGLGTRFLLNWFVYSRPRLKLGWDPALVRWFWGFGRPAWAATNLSYLLDNFDNYWVGTSLGSAALGFYSRAFDFARYPRRVFGNPMAQVLTPVFARLQADRLRLSQAFYRTAHLLVRTGLLLAGLLAVIMPEVIRLAIGDQWQPLLWPFRLFVLYMALDPLSMLVENLLLVVGRPADVRRAHLVQAIAFLPAVVLAAWLAGIAGVAIAVDGMMLLGVILFYRPLRQVLDFSLSRLFAWPAIALLAAGGAAWWIEARMGTPGLLTLGAKTGAFVLVYAVIALAAERADYARGLRWLWQLARSREVPS